jgi:hypothetical protein
MADVLFWLALAMFLLLVVVAWTTDRLPHAVAVVFPFFLLAAAAVGKFLGY